jgi:hypothetical protein
MRLNRFSIKIVTLITALTLSVGCTVDFMGATDPPSSGPYDPDDGGLEDSPGGDLKRPIPIKPKKNPGGKIERPKFIDDLLNKVYLP